MLFTYWLRSGLRRSEVALTFDVVQFAVAKLDAKVLVAVTACFSLSAVLDSITNNIDSVAVGAINGQGQRLSPERSKWD
jgi:hypothetical protein